MYYIAVCDDEEIVCSQIEDTILDYGKSICETIEIDVFYSGEELYKFLKEGSCYDMIFLDIELKMLNGVELGVKIRDELKNESVQIIYVSAKEDYAMELFKIRPMNFIIKPIDAETIRKVFEKGMELLNKSCQCFYFKQGHLIKKKPIKDILYFESMNRQVKMVTLEGEIIFYGSLSDIYYKLKEYHFFYIHKSFLVNYNHIIEFGYEQIVMSNKIILPISQSKRKGIREMQLRFEEEGL